MLYFLLLFSFFSPLLWKWSRVYSIILWSLKVAPGTCSLTFEKSLGFLEKNELNPRKWIKNRKKLKYMWTSFSLNQSLADVKYSILSVILIWQHRCLLRMCIRFFVLYLLLINYINNNNNNDNNFFDSKAFISKLSYRVYLLIFKEKQVELQIRIKTNYYEEKNQIPHA